LTYLRSAATSDRRGAPGLRAVGAASIIASTVCQAERRDNHDAMRPWRRRVYRQIRHGLQAQHLIHVLHLHDVGGTAECSFGSCMPCRNLSRGRAHSRSSAVKCSNKPVAR
jgi:hypothetical protein